MIAVRDTELQAENATAALARELAEVADASERRNRALFAVIARHTRRLHAREQNQHTQAAQECPQ